MAMHGNTKFLFELSSEGSLFSQLVINLNIEGKWILLCQCPGEVFVQKCKIRNMAEYELTCVRVATLLRR